MNESAVYLEQIKGMSAMLADVVAPLDDELLRRRPGPALNPPGFIYFHLLRVWDLDLNRIIRGQAADADAWRRGGFSAETGYEPIGKGGGGRGIGFGYTDAEVDEVPYAAGWLRRYHEQLLAETVDYLATANDAELRREIRLPQQEQPVSPALRLQHTIAHSWNHIGELRMTKSMLGFPDPSTPRRA